MRALLALRNWGPTLAGTVVGAAAVYDDAVAVVADGQATTFAELHERTNALARAFTNRGVHAGSVVGLVARNGHPFVESCVALSKVGADVLLLNAAAAPAQLIEICRAEGVSALVYDDVFTEVADTLEPDTICFPTSTLDALVRSHTTVGPTPPERPGRTILLTSGTTGRPKGATRGAPPVSFDTLGLLDAIPYHQGEAMLVAAPLFHAWGFAHLSLALALGSPLVLLPQFDPDAVVHELASRKVGVLVAVPVMLRRILDCAAAQSPDLPALRVVPLSGSAIPAGLAEAFMDHFGEVVYSLYGSTEAGSVSVANPADLRAAPGTAGHPNHGVSVRIVDAHGHPLPVGASGHIVVCSDLVFEGYTDGRSSTTFDGHVDTGDVGHLDDDGRLFVEGRSDDMIVSGGENVHPREVEDLLATHPDVVEAAVIGVDDTDFGQRLAAYVVRRPDATLDADAVRDHVRNHLARFKVPRDVVFVDELPRNAAGKVVRRALPDLDGGPAS